VITPILDGPTDHRTVRERLSLALERAADGRLRPAIGATSPLARAADAHRTGRAYNGGSQYC
jgi:NADPH2:quinone reductase